MGPHTGRHTVGGGSGTVPPPGGTVQGGLMTSTTTPDFAAIKNAQRAGWENGDYPRVGNTLQIIAEELVEAADVRAGQRVLDVACGQGNAAMAAARRFAHATGVDYATNLLAQGRDRAAAEHLP